MGKRLLQMLKGEIPIVAMGRRHPSVCEAPEHPDITYVQADITQENHFMKKFKEVVPSGSADLLILLAAYYDFDEGEKPEYWQVNVEGTRTVLEAAKASKIPHVIFSSSVAACQYPPEGESLDESSPPDGDHIYARTKAEGERLLNEIYAEDFHYVIMRFPALFSDWCEYLPLYFFLDTWWSDALNARILAGSGKSAVPYLHVDDVVFFIRKLIHHMPYVPSGSVLIPSADGSVTHEELFRASTEAYFGDPRKPIFCPRPLCRVGISMRYMASRLTSETPFEAPWMVAHIDRQLRVDARKTRTLMQWEPRPRLDILRRMPFLVEHVKADIVEWRCRNHAILYKHADFSNLIIHRLLSTNENAILEQMEHCLLAKENEENFPYFQICSGQERGWNCRLILHQLMNAILAKRKTIFTTFCRDFALKQYSQGISWEELRHIFEVLETTCVEIIAPDAKKEELEKELRDLLGGTLTFGKDQMEDVYEYQSQLKFHT